MRERTGLHGLEHIHPLNAKHQRRLCRAGSTPAHTRACRVSALVKRIAGLDARRVDVIVAVAILIELEA